MGSVGVARHGVPYAGTGAEYGYMCHDCGGVVPVDLCREHRRAVAPVMEPHPGGGICTALAKGWARAESSVPSAHP